MLSVALFYFLRTKELDSQLRQAAEAWQQKEDGYTAELAKLEELRHIPDVIERARNTKAEVEARLAEAQNRAEDILERAMEESRERGEWLRADIERELKVSQEEAQRSRSAAESMRDEAREGAEGREVAGGERPRGGPEGGQRGRVEGQEGGEGEAGEGGSGPGPGLAVCPGDPAEGRAAGPGDRRGGVRGQGQVQGVPGRGGRRCKTESRGTRAYIWSRRPTFWMNWPRSSASHKAGEKAEDRAGADQAHAGERARPPPAAIPTGGRRTTPSSSSSAPSTARSTRSSRG